jgi:multisubunit Na+/H+ antiporter MnhB subunit
MDELLRVVVLGLEWFALWLERSPLHVAWPILLALVFQVVVFVVHGFVWFSRGMFLPVPCDYPRTTSRGRGPCKNRTFGEWHRCHLHRRSWRRRSDSHQVDPTLPRWQTIVRGVRKERDDIRGEGVVRSRSRSIGVLYYRGFARKPAEVRRLVPELIRDYRNRLVELREQFQQRKSGHRKEKTAARSGVSTAVWSIRASTQFALIVVLLGIVCVALALALRLRRSPDLGLRLSIEYYAALLFFLGVSVAKNGIWGERKQRVLVPHEDWLRRSWKETAGSFGAAIVLAWIVGTIGRSLGDIAEALPTVIVVGGWLLLASLPVDSRSSYRRRHRRRGYRPRRRRSSW